MAWIQTYPYLSKTFGNHPKYLLTSRINNIKKEKKNIVLTASRLSLLVFHAQPGRIPRLARSLLKPLGL